MKQNLLYINFIAFAVLFGYVCQAYAAPMVETIAAPAVQYTSAPVVTQAPSFVAAPQVVETVVAGPQFGMPQPRSLTEGLVTPAKLEQERLAYEKALEAQLGKQSTAVLEDRLRCGAPVGGGGRGINGDGDAYKYWTKP